MSELVLSDADDDLRASAARAAVALVAPPQALLPLLAHGEICAAIRLIHHATCHPSSTSHSRNSHAEAFARGAEPPLHEHCARQAWLLRSRALLDAAAAADGGQRLYAMLALCRLTDAREPECTRQLMQHALGAGGPGGRREQHACACVLCHLLREGVARIESRNGSPPSLGLLGALALLRGIERDWPAMRIADDLADDGVPHMLVEQLVLATQQMTLAVASSSPK